MADKRIYELTVSTVKTGKYLALDSSGQVAAHAYSADLLLSNVEADGLFVHLVGSETIAGAKTFTSAMGIGGAPGLHSLKVTGGAEADYFTLVPSALIRIGSSGNDMQLTDATVGTVNLSQLLAGQPTGASGEIPFMNGGATDFAFSPSLVYALGILDSAAGFKSTSLSVGNDSLIMATGGGIGAFTTSVNLYYQNSILTVGGTAATSQLHLDHSGSYEWQIVANGDTSLSVEHFSDTPVVITFDKVAINSKLELGSGAIVDTIETTLTNDAAHLATSSAIFAAIGSATLSLGSNGQVPFVNGSGTDFLYSASVTYSTGTFTVPNLAISALANDGAILYSVIATGAVTQTSVLYWSSPNLHTQGIQLAAGNAVNNIETALTNDTTHIATSSAIFAAIAAVPTQILSLGTNGQVPYMNAGGTDFVYSSGFNYDGSGGHLYAATSFRSLYLYINGTSMYINSSGANLQFTDGITGSKTLAELAAVGITFGSAGAIAVTNTGSTDFSYSASFTFLLSILTAPKLALTAGATVDTIETTLTNSATTLPTSSAVFGAIAAVPTQILSLGSNGQVPFMNGAGTDFLYSANVNYSTGTFTVPALAILSKAADGGVLFSTIATGVVTQSGNLTFDGTTLFFPELGLGAATNLVDTIESSLTNDVTHIATSSAIFAAIAAVPTQILSLGASTRIPYMNGAGTDFLYSAGLIFDGTTLEATELALTTGTIVDTIETTLTNDNDHLPTSGAVFAAIAAVSPPSYGLNGQVPFMNGAGTDFLYSSSVTYSTGVFTVPNFAISALANDGAILYSVVATGAVTQTSVLYWSSPNLHTQGIQLAAGNAVNNIETTLTNDTTHIATSSAIFAAIGAASGLSWTGSTANAVGTYGSSSTIVAEANLLFDGTNLGLNTSPVANQRIAVVGDTNDWLFVGTHDRTYVQWSNFPTVLPTRVFALHRNGATVDGGINDYTAISLNSKGGGAYSSYCVLAVQSLSASNNSSRFNVLLRGVSSTDYETVFSADYNSTFYWRSPSTTLDIRHIFIESATTVGMFGWDYSTSHIKLQVGSQALGTTPYFFVSSSQYGYYGSSSVSCYMDAATTTVSVYLQANTGYDSSIYFRENTSTQFIMGHDASVSRFQIHSSTSYSTAGDFQMSTSGHIGLGAIPNSNDKLYVYDNNTSGTHYAIKIFMDGNNATAARGLFIQCGLDTLTTSDNTYLWCTDGNGTTVGTLLADTTSFRIFNAVSSRDYKTNIREIDENVTAKFRNTKSQPKRYNYIGRTKRERDEIAAKGGDPTDLVGFVIEDLKEEFPDAVKVIDGVPMYADTALIPYLVKAVVELSNEIEQLKNPII